MKVPTRLYKYRSASLQDITNLSAGKVWFSRPTRFNDPFDCAYDILIPELSRADCIKLIALASDGKFTENNLAGFSDESLKQQVSAGLKQSVQMGLSAVGGVSCFSAIHDNLLMWGHYAQSHHGFCLEYSTCNDILFQKAMPVRYTDSLPALNLEAFSNSDFEQVMSLLLTKAKCWEYEQEWRVLHQEPDKLYGYERSSLTGIYFGAKMPEDQMMMIAALLEKTDTKLHRMKLSKSSFALESEQITFTRSDFRDDKKQ